MRSLRVYILTKKNICDERKITQYTYVAGTSYHILYALGMKTSSFFTAFYQTNAITVPIP